MFTYSAQVWRGVLESRRLTCNDSRRGDREEKSGGLGDCHLGKGKSANGEELEAVHVVVCVQSWLVWLVFTCDKVVV